MTAELLKKCIPTANQANIEKYFLPLSISMDVFNINTPARQAAFLAQIAHESQALAFVVENMNYSADRLLAVFPKYFTTATAPAYHKQPVKIANHVYANRMGNGAPESGDGWKYRGRALMHLTGADMYEACSKYLGIDFVNHPELLETPANSAKASAWCWAIEKKLNKIADLNTPNGFKKISIAINGGLNGYDERVIHWNNCRKALNI